MYFIKEVDLQNIRQLKDQVIPFEKGVNIIIGENGTCKTTILKVIALSMCQKYMASALYLDSKESFKRARSKESVSKIKFTSKEHSEDVICETNFTMLEDKNLFKKTNLMGIQDAPVEVLYSICGVFGAQRNSSVDFLQTDIGAEITPNEFFKPLFGNPQNFIDPVFAYELFIKFYKKYPFFQQHFLKVQAQLLTYLKMPKGSKFVIHDRLREGEKVKELSVEVEKGLISFYDFSDGQKSVALMVFGILYGVALNIPRLKDTKAVKGVVLIDEIENHLHPMMERRILRFLTRCFPEIQFIVTTHSPNIIMGMDKANVISLQRKNSNLVIARSFIPKELDETISVSEVLNSRELFNVPIFTDGTEKKISQYNNLLKIVQRTKEENEKLNDLASYFYRHELRESIDIDHYRENKND